MALFIATNANGKYSQASGVLLTLVTPLLINERKRPMSIKRAQATAIKFTVNADNRYVRYGR